MTFDEENADDLVFTIYTTTFFDPNIVHFDNFH